MGADYVENPLPERPRRWLQITRRDLLHQRNAEFREWSKDDWNPGLFAAEVMKVDLYALGGRSWRQLATGREHRKEQSMKLRDWEVTIQKMIEESNQEPKESGKYRTLTKWRAILAQEPHLLQPYQIDEIVREVRNRLTSGALNQAAVPRFTSPVPAWGDEKSDFQHPFAVSALVPRTVGGTGATGFASTLSDSSVERWRSLWHPLTLARWSRGTWTVHRHHIRFHLASSSPLSPHT